MIPSLLLLLAACERAATYPVNTAHPTLVVHGVLVAGTREQEILVEYGRSIEEGVFTGITPASGAEVVVMGDLPQRFAEDRAHPGRYRAQFTPQAGMRYTLAIRGPKGEAVTGSTEVPAPPRLLEPALDTTIRSAQFLRVRWTEAAGAAGYFVVAPDLARRGAMGILPHPGNPQATEASLQFHFNGGTGVRVWVSAVDTHFLTHQQHIAARDAGPGYRLTSTVEGAWGLFGSVSHSDSRLVRFK